MLVAALFIFDFVGFDKWGGSVVDNIPIGVYYKAHKQMGYMVL